MRNFFLNLDEYNPMGVGALEEDIILDYEREVLNNEVYVRIAEPFGLITEKDKVRITARLNNSEDIIALLSSVNVLKSFGFKRISVLIPYIPYSNNWIQLSSGDISLEMFAELINKCGFEEVFYFETHNSEIDSKITNATPIKDDYFMDRVIEDLGENFNEGVVFVGMTISDVASLKRNCKKLKLSNKVMSYMDVQDKLLRGKTIIVFQNIVDKTESLTELSQYLHTRSNVKRVLLVTTHGIFREGLSLLTTWYERIYTTSSFKGSRDGYRIKELEYLP